MLFFVGWRVFLDRFLVAEIFVVRILCKIRTNEVST